MYLSKQSNYSTTITHSCPDVTDDSGKTPLDLITEKSTEKYLNQDERKECAKLNNYLKSLPTEHSELLLHHN